MTTFNNKNIGVTLTGLIYISFKNGVDQDEELVSMFRANDWSVERFFGQVKPSHCEIIGEYTFNYYTIENPALSRGLALVSNENERLVMNAWFVNLRKPVIVSVVTNGSNLEVKAPFSGSFNEEIKAARVGAHFDGNKKVWIVPVSTRGKAALWNAIKVAYPKAILTTNGRTLQVAA